MRVPLLFRILFPIIAAALPALALRPGIPRITAFTDHFSLTIDASKSDMLPRLAALAESCWARQARFFEYQPPGRIQMVFLDEQDYANGYAYSPQEWVIIHLHSAEFLLRGRTRWLPNVMAHEIGHVFTLRKMGDVSRFLGWGLFHRWNGKGPSSFEEEFHWSHGRIPPWLAEGLAQYAAAACGYDSLDNRRLMELRVAAASGRLLSPSELKGFAWDGRRNEMIYAQGFALVSWMYAAFGPPAMNRYMEAANASNWRSAFRKAFGKSFARIYAEWRKALEAKSHYEPENDGTRLLPEPDGPWAVELFPAPLGDGRFLFLSSRDNDYGETDLFLADSGGGARKIFRTVGSLRVDSEGGKAYFTATRHALAQADVLSDLYAYDLGSGNVARLTTGGRIIRGCAAGGTVYGLRNDQGRTSIVRIAGGAWNTVYAAPESLEITDLAPGRTPATLTLGTASGFGADLRELDLGTLELTPLAVSPQEEVDPYWSGDTLYFSADYAGAFDIYASANGNVSRLTQVDGGAFHPRPAKDGLWISAYGPTGFRLTRARAPASPEGSRAQPFFVQLPTPGWRLPPPIEIEADSYDRSRLSLLGFDLALGMERNPGFRETFTTPPRGLDTGGTHVLTVDAGSRALASAGFYWANPNGVMDAEARIGLSYPIGYEGRVHLDRSALEMRIRALHPEIVAGLGYSAYDYPNLAVDSISRVYWESRLEGRLGAELRLAQHWMVSARGLAAGEFSHDEQGGDRDSDLRFGAEAALDFFDLQHGKDGIVKGFSAFAEGGVPPRVRESVPEAKADAGARLYSSLGRILFLEGSLFQTSEFADSAAFWLYGGARAYASVPLGWRLGTKGGAGWYWDRLLPMVEYREMARFRGEKGGTEALSPAPPDRRWFRRNPAFEAEALAPRIAGFGDLIRRGISHEAGFGLALRTLSLSGHTAWCSAFLRFDAADFGREPSWSVSISL